MAELNNLKISSWHLKTIKVYFVLLKKFTIKSGLLLYCVIYIELHFHKRNIFAFMEMFISKFFWLIEYK